VNSGLHICQQFDYNTILISKTTSAADSSNIISASYGFDTAKNLVHNYRETNSKGVLYSMFDIAIIGAGPAGASAALFTAKAGKKTLVLDSDHSVTKRAWLENHYGVSEISGPDLVDVGKKQAAKFGAELVQGKAVNIQKNGEGFKIETEEGRDFEATYVIIATGMSVDLAQKIGLQTKDGTEPRIKTVLDVDGSGKTNVTGIWAAGTVAGVSMHTIITAGDGAKVAINLISEINGERYVDHDMIKA
jgi:thioredoxin reductase (NADPH)